MNTQPDSIGKLRDKLKALDLRPALTAFLGEPTSRSGQHWSWPCPFHVEESPGGFHVYPNRFVCFSAKCGVQGDLIDFYQASYETDFRTAVRELAEVYFPGLAGPQVAARKVDLAAAPAGPVPTREQAESEARRLEQQLSATLDELRSARKWIEYHDNMGEIERDLWHARGIPGLFQDLWQLGFSPLHTIWRKVNGRYEQAWSGPTLTIPIWQPAPGGGEGIVMNIKHRLLTPYAGGKYHTEKRGVKPAAFFADTDTRSGPILITEGEIKGMVAFVTLSGGDTFPQVAGLPGSRLPDDFWSAFDAYDPVTLNLDPDAWERQSPKVPSAFERAVTGLRERVPGRAIKVLRLPKKLDDLILDARLDAAWLAAAMRSAQRVA